MAVGTRMQQRRATAADWNTSDYLLAAGELGITLDTGIIKIGDGVNTWTELPIAFDAQYLPLLGKAADSELIDGVSVESLVKVADTDVNATNNTYVKRTADGGVKGTDATESSELTTLSQVNAVALAAKQLSIVRTVTANTTLDINDVGKMVMVNHSSLTAQVTVTIPLNASVPYPLGTQITICANGAGGAKIGGSGITMRGKYNVMPGYGTIILTKINTDTWLGEESKQGRFPRIKVVRTGSGQSYGAAYAFVPFNSVDSTETYNPDDEWFSIPGTGLSTARRIIINKDGEYQFNVSLAMQGTSAITYARIAKMTADNSTSGMKIKGVDSMQAVCCFAKTFRVTAGESFGIHHGFATGCTDKADDEAAGNDPHHFSIMRVGD